MFMEAIDNARINSLRVVIFKSISLKFKKWIIYNSMKSKLNNPMIIMIQRTVSQCNCGRIVNYHHFEKKIPTCTYLRVNDTYFELELLTRIYALFFENNSFHFELNFLKIQSDI